MSPLALYLTWYFTGATVCFFIVMMIYKYFTKEICTKRDVRHALWYYFCIWPMGLILVLIYGAIYVFDEHRSSAMNLFLKFMNKGK